MIKKLHKRREDLTAKYMNAQGFQKGFTLMEMLAVIVIVLILIGIMLFAFNFFGRVDGTELAANSKKVESGVLQNALANAQRDIPGNKITGDTQDEGEIVSRADGKTATELVKFDGASFFDVQDDAEIVLKKVAKDAGLTLDELYGLMRPVDKGVQSTISGNAKSSDYVVIVKKSQVYKTDSVSTGYASYNDSLAGTVFSKTTIKDNDGYYYNGTNKAK